MTLLLAAACGSIATIIVFQIRSLIQERREFAEQQRRDDKWDRVHGVGTRVMSTTMRDGYEPPSAALGSKGA